MVNNKHLTLSERIKIEQSLNKKDSFKSIGKDIDKDCTTISKEVKSHFQYKLTGSFGKAFNNCVYRYDCTNSHLCNDSDCKNKFCRFCSACRKVCSDYQKQSCGLLLKPPYVCNGCDKRKGCTLEKAVYVASYAQSEYESVRSESRQGVQISEDEVLKLDSIISPLISNGQSLHHICSNHMDEIMWDERSIYNYVDVGILSVKNIDLPRKVRYRGRKPGKKDFKVDTKCRTGRTYGDFLLFTQNYLDTPIVEIDSVEGIKGGKVLLTIHFTIPQLMLAFIRDSNTSQSVINIFNKLYLELSPDIFCKLFPLLLGDNGSEFSNPTAIEFDEQGNRRASVFYCDPSAPYQKGAAENNHELIRRIIPKGKSMDCYDQKDIQLMMSHINSYGRKKLGDKSPYEVFSSLYGENTLRKLGITFIHNDKVMLRPALLKK